eukprot:8224650-Pyramimonas_sp.AAC.1
MDAAPKAAKQTYEAFLQQTAALLGGEMAGEELYAAAEVVFESLAGGTAPTEDSSRYLLSTQHAPIKCVRSLRPKGLGRVLGF